MKKIIYLLNDELIISLWSSKERVGCYHFENSLLGKKLLRDYLSSSSKTPVRIVVDIEEEDFKTQNIPKVYLNNLVTLVNRYKLRIYPDSQFIKAAPVSLQNKEKKKCAYRFSSINNPLLLLHLIGTLNSYNIPIVGIWSAAILGEGLSQLFKSRSEHSLLVVSPRNGFYRQSYFYKNKLIFSRLMNVGNEDKSLIYLRIVDEIEQTKKFLFNQKMIAFNDILSVDVIDCEEVCNAAIDNSNVELNESITWHVIDDVSKRLSIKNTGFEHIDSLLSFVVSKTASRNDDYSIGDIKNLFVHNRISKSLLFSSFMVVVLASIFSQYYVLEGMRLSDLSSDADNSLLRAISLYEGEFSTVNEDLQKSDFIVSTVNAVTELQNEKEFNPLNFYIQLSEILSIQDFKSIRLLALNWKKESSFTRLSVQDTNNDDDPVMLDTVIAADSIDPAVEEVFDNNNSVVTNKIKQIILLEGELIGNNSIVTMKTTLDDFVLSLKNRLNAHDFVIKRLPVDVRSEVKLDGGSGSEFSTSGKKFSYQFVLGS